MSAECRNVRWEEDGRTALITIPVAREIYERLLADWQRAGWYRLSEVGGELTFLFSSSETKPPAEVK